MKRLLVTVVSLLLLGGACASPPPPPVVNPQSYDSHSSNVSSAPDAALALMSAGVDAAIGASRRAKNSAKKIFGHCVVFSGELSSPCSSMLVLLKDHEGEILRQERTDEKGDFVFSVGAEQGYRLDVKSSRYKVSFEPEAPFVADSHVLLELRPL